MPPPARFVILNQSLGPLYRQVAESLAQRGHVVTVLAGADNRFDYPGVTFLAGPVYERRSLRGRLQSWWAFLRFARRELPRLSPGAVVLSFSNPPLLPHLCARIAGRHSAHVACVLDLYPEVLASSPSTARLKFLYPLFGVLNRAAYRRCAEIVTLGPVMAAGVARYAGGRTPAIIPTWHTLDQARVPPRLDNPLRRELGFGDRLVVLYSGNLGLSHDLNILLDAAEQLRGVDRVRFVIIGEGPQRERLQDSARARGLGPMFHFLPYQPLAQLPVSLSLGDLSVVTIRPGAEAAMMPSKIHNYLAAGSAVLAITRRPSDLAQVVEEHRCGFVVEPGDARALAGTLRLILEQPETLAPLRERARRAAQEHYSPEVCCPRFVELLEKTASRLSV
jgi:glycosyltransferase involved in cell wall biosynthesis